MSNVSKRSTVNQGWCVFQSLNQVWMDSVFEHSSHSATSFQILSSYWLTFKAVANDDFFQTVLEVGNIF